MFRTKSGLRKIAAIISITAALSITAPAAAQAAAAHPATETFMKSKFTGYTTLAGFSGDYGIALEMILQRSAAGETLAELGTPVSYLLTRANVIGNVSTRTGYLFNTDSAKSLKPGLAGKFIFTSQAVGAPTEDTLQWNIFKELSKTVSTNGTVSGATNDLDYAWVLMASSAYGWNTQGNRVAQRMIALQNTDGGFSSWGSDSAVDATALALQALVLNRWVGTDAQDKARTAAINKALGYIQRHDSQNNRINYSDGNFDVNSTGYAAMAIDALAATLGAGSTKTALNDLAEAYAVSLRSQLLKAGGFKVYWAPRVGDAMATSQAYAAVISKTYNQLLND
ncbi:MAG: hypothetical protein RLZZ258_693 [Actinomycetota bacterium]|jgi:hypothetical protein